jgi:hypothetical protein
MYPDLSHLLFILSPLGLSLFAGGVVIGVVVTSWLVKDKKHEC